VIDFLVPELLLTLSYTTLGHIHVCALCGISSQLLIAIVRGLLGWSKLENNKSKMMEGRILGNTQTDEFQPVGRFAPYLVCSFILAISWSPMKIFASNLVD